MAKDYAIRPFGSGPHSVAWADYVWNDFQRGRSVPVRIYYPADADATNGAKKSPVIVFSTGLGRSRDDCAYLGRHWAGCGYVSVHVQHVGSDESARKGTLRPRKELQRAFYDPGNIQNRPMDVIFVIDQLEQMQREGRRPAEHFDFTRIGVSGHDFGAQTVLGIAGQVLPGSISFAESRAKAVVAMSAPVPLGQVPLDVAYTDIALPCMHITGTADNSIVGITKAYQRRLPFDHTAGADQYLLTLNGADHMTYSGHVRSANGQNDALYQRLIAESSTVFWDAYLKDDAGAKAWLSNGGLAGYIGAIGRLEKKLVP